MELIDAISGLRFETSDFSVSVADFKLIEDSYPKVDVFIETDEEAVLIWRKYEKLKEYDNFFDKKAAFNKIKNKFYEFVISIPSNAKNMPPEVMGFRYVNKNSLSDFYDSLTGYLLDDCLSIW